MGNLIFLAFGYFLLFDWAGLNWSRPLLIGSLNSQKMISFMITTGSLNIQGMIRILKQWRHDFSGKNLCDRFCMDIMWCFCRGQNSRFCKASLRICYASLFECKGINCYKLYKLLCVAQKITKLDWKSTLYILLNYPHSFVFNVFSFLILFFYIINIGYWQVLFVTKE